MDGEQKKCTYCQSDISISAKKCPQCQTDLRSWFRRHIILSTIGIFIVLSIILSSFDEASTKIETSNTEGTNTVIEEENTYEESTKEIIVNPEPITLSGFGQQASDTFILSSGISIFHMKHGGTGHFSMNLLNENGDNVSLLVNEIGSFDGSKVEKINTKGTYILNVSADGNWSIEIEQPRAIEASQVTNFNGHGQEASPFFNLNKGLKTFQMQHDGTGHFSMTLLDKNGNRIGLLVNEIGYFNGSKAIKISKNNSYILDVSADGDWSVSFK